MLRSFSSQYTSSPKFFAQTNSFVQAQKVVGVLRHPYVSLTSDKLVQSCRVIFVWYIVFCSDHCMLGWCGSSLFECTYLCLLSTRHLTRRHYASGFQHTLRGNAHSNRIFWTIPSSTIAGHELMHVCLTPCTSEWLRKLLEIGLLLETALLLVSESTNGSSPAARYLEKNSPPKYLGESFAACQIVF